MKKERKPIANYIEFDEVATLQRGVDAQSTKTNLLGCSKVTSHYDMIMAVRIINYQLGKYYNIRLACVEFCFAIYKLYPTNIAYYNIRHFVCLSLF